MPSPARMTSSHSGIINCLIIIGAVATLGAVMHLDYTEEAESDCRSRFGAEARYNFQSNSCWVPPPPLPECRKPQHHDQSKGPPTFGALCHVPAPVSTPRKPLT